MTPTAIIISQLIIQYGIPGAIQITQLLQKPDFTIADLEGLRGLVRLPESYLTDSKK